MMKKLLVISFFLFNSISYGETERIQSYRFDRSKSQAIYLAPGLGSIVLFPCSLEEVFVGRSEDVKVQISPNDRKSLFINLKKNSSVPTNIICRCEGERTVFVFDLVPSKSQHQDVVELRNSFGRAVFKENMKAELKLHSSKSKVVVIKEPQLIKDQVTR